MKAGLNKQLYSPALLIEYKGYPVNRFTAEVYNAEGEQVYTNKFSGIIHCDNIHGAYIGGLKHLEQAMKDDNTYYRIEKYGSTLQEFANRKYFNSWIKRKLYALYLEIGKLFL